VAESRNPRHVYTDAVASKPSSAAARAYEQLRSDILEGVFEPGATLFEVEQSERLGVSRTPVREAFGRLVAEGLLDDRRGRGLAVTDVSDRDIDALYEMRTCLEAQAAQLAARHADPEVFTGYARDFQQWHASLGDDSWLHSHHSNRRHTGLYRSVGLFHIFHTSWPV